MAAPGGELLIGLMSGTSMDGVDAVLARLPDGKPPETLARHSVAMPTELRAELLALLDDGGDLARIGALDTRLGQLFARAALELLDTSDTPAAAVRAIGSHGQTVWHAPGAAHPFTWQIGNPHLIAELTGITTVADFRRRDVAAGGQGAPLAPLFHAAFFRSGQESRAVLNLGGIGNLTFLPADPDTPVTGFDTGPANVLMDGWTQRHLGQPMDRDGAWALQGRPNATLLERLLDEPFLRLMPPRSTGRELFNLDWLERHLAALKPMAAVDVQATLLHYSAHSAANAVRAHAGTATRLLLCGGGARNRGLVAALRGALPGMEVDSTAALGVDPGDLEALGFAWLALRTLNGLPGNLVEVTGARGTRILGAIHPA